MRWIATPKRGRTRNKRDDRRPLAVPHMANEYLRDVAPLPSRIRRSFMGKRGPSAALEDEVTKAVWDRARMVRIARGKKRGRVIGPEGLPLEVEQRIIRLIRARVPSKEIAELMEVARDTVFKIAAGYLGPQSRKYVRCPSCGGMVIRPCRLCEGRIDQRRARQRDKDGK